MKLEEGRKKLITKKLDSVANTLRKKSVHKGDLLEAVLNLTFVLEQFFKIKIAKKNILLVYSKLPETDQIKKILNKECVENNNTIKALDAFNLFKILFPKTRLAKQKQSVELIITARNEIYHHIVPYKKINNAELQKLVLTTFHALINDSQTVFKYKAPAKQEGTTFTTEEVEKIFDKVVEKKIQKRDSLFTPGMTIAGYYNEPLPISGILSTTGLECPRCGFYTLQSPTEDLSFVLSASRSFAPGVLYKCQNCHLELTEEEYEAVQRIQKKNKPL